MNKQIIDDILCHTLLVQQLPTDDFPESTIQDNTLVQLKKTLILHITYLVY